MDRIKLCILRSDTLSIPALDFMLRVARQSNLGTPEGAYGEPPTPNGAGFSEWGIICEKGIVCSKKVGQEKAIRLPSSKSKSIEEHVAAFKSTFRDERYRQADCPFCTKGRGDHSDAETDACVDILRKKEEKARARSGIPREDKS